MDRPAMNSRRKAITALSTVTIIVAAMLTAATSVGSRQPGPPSSGLRSGAELAGTRRATELVFPSDLKQRSGVPAATRILGVTRDKLRVYVVSGTGPSRPAGSGPYFCVVALTASLRPSVKGCSDTRSLLRTPFWFARDIAGNRMEVTGLVRDGYRVARVGSKQYRIVGNVFDIVLPPSSSRLVLTGTGTPSVTIRAGSVHRLSRMLSP
jgi:hypothetical protein